MIDTGGGARRSVISFSGTITGLQALQLAGANPVTYGYAGQGSAVCALDGVGHEATQGACLGTLDDPRYWTYFRSPAGSSGWTYSRGCACTTTVHDGDVEGWRFGTGQSPPYSSFCAVAGCAPPPPPSPPPTAAAPPPPSVQGTSVGAAPAGASGATGATGTTGSGTGKNATRGSANGTATTAAGDAPATGANGTCADSSTTAGRDQGGSDRRASAGSGGSGSGGDSGGGSPWGVVGAVVLVGGLVGGGWWLRRRRTATPPTT